MPSAEERTKRGLFHYGTDAWLLNFKKNDQGDVEKLTWVIDDKIPVRSFFRDSLPEIISREVLAYVEQTLLSLILDAYTRPLRLSRDFFLCKV